MCAKFYFNDTIGNQNVTSNSCFTVQNTAPTIPTTLTLKDPVNVSATLTANASGSIDADSDAITYYYEFYNLNDTTTVQAYSVDGSYIIDSVDAHDKIRVRVKAYDNINYSEEKEVNRSISNSIPSFNESLTTQFVVHSVNFVYDVNCSDLDGDSLTYYDNTSLFDINSSTGLINDDPSVFDTGVYYVMISCGDGAINSSTAFVYNITNNAPGMNSSSILPSTAYTNNTLKGFCNASDVDGDYLNYYYRWFNDSGIITSGNLSSFAEGLEVNINNLVV